MYSTEHAREIFRERYEGQPERVIGVLVRCFVRGVDCRGYKTLRVIDAPHGDDLLEVLCWYRYRIYRYVFHPLEKIVTAFFPPWFRYHEI